MCICVCVCVCVVVVVVVSELFCIIMMMMIIMIIIIILLLLLINNKFINKHLRRKMYRMECSQGSDSRLPNHACTVINRQCASVCV